VAQRYVIVGSGIAGLSAAETVRQRDPGAEITLITDEPHDFYSRPGLAYFLTGELPEKQLFARTQAEMRALRVKPVRARVTGLIPEAHQVILDKGQSLSYDRLLLATGSTAVPPDFPGGELAGVVKLDNLDDARRILKLAGRGRTAVVVGGGVAALELVEGLRARDVHTHYFLRGDRYWSNVLDETESRIVEDRLKNEGVTIHYRTQVKEALSQQGRLIGVETTASEKLPCHVLAVAIGVRPRVELARQAGLKVDRGILVDEFLQTSAPNVYAAGDVAQVHDPPSGRSILDVLWSTALAQGQIAGANLAGASIPYVRQVAFNVTRLAGLTTTIIGAVGSGHDEDLVTIARGDSEAWRMLPESWVISDRQDVNRVRLLVKEQTIVGALIMGDQTLSRPLYRLIAAQADITPIQATLRAHGVPILDTILSFYQQWEPVSPSGRA
jgi:NADPH-dependent 2,4-dienoyl-CoA reductase/sulfur reductase-like enzyme